MTSASALAAPGPEGRSWTHVLLGAVRPEFRAAVYIPDAGDRVLAARAPTDAQLERGPAERCAIGVCRRSVYLGGLCRSHRARWHRAGRPALEGFVAGVGAVNTRHLICALPGCGFPVAGLSGLCDTHHRRFTSMCRYHPGLEPADSIARVLAPRGGRGPRFDSRGLGRVLTLELQFVLQCRHDARGAVLTPRMFTTVVGWARAAGVGSLLECGDSWWKEGVVGGPAPRGAPAGAGVRALRARPAASAGRAEQRPRAVGLGHLARRSPGPGRPLGASAGQAHLLLRHRARVAARLGQALGQVATGRGGEVAGRRRAHQRRAAPLLSLGGGQGSAARCPGRADPRAARGLPCRPAHRAGDRRRAPAVDHRRPEGVSR